MANFAYTRGLRDLLKGDVDFDTATLMVILCMANTTAKNEGSAGRDAATVSAITLDEYDGSGYTAGFAGRPTLAGGTVIEDAAGNRAAFDANDLTIANLGAGTRNCIGVLIAIKKTSDTDSVPLAWIDEGGFPFNGTGESKKFQISPGGLLELVSEAA